MKGVIDKLLRGCALLTCVIAAFAVLMMGAFASDSGSLKAELISDAIILGGWALLGVVVVACFIKRPFATGLAYLVGGIGIVLAIAGGARILG